MNNTGINTAGNGSNGVLMRAGKSVLGEKVFLCFQGRRHYVPSADRLMEYGFRWPDDVYEVDDSILLNYNPGGHLPSLRASLDDLLCKANATAMREAMGSELKGYGLEIGAGTSAFPLPLHCRVLYADMVGTEELKLNLYPGDIQEELVIPYLITDFGELGPIGDESLDFIIGCHVIEHTRNPIGAIMQSHQKLKKGGKLLLVVPDKERTFDKPRPVTELEHLFQDFHEPDRPRDLEHYKEFYRLAFPINPCNYEDFVMDKYRNNYPIHYHVWDYHAFSELVKFIDDYLFSWSDVWSHPALADMNNDIEFYFLLTK